MTAKPESRLQRKIREGLEDEVGGFWRKQWGGPFTGAGLPDLLGYVHGIPFQLEVKRPVSSSKPSEIQLKTILSLRLHGVVADIVTSLDEALWIVRSNLKDPTLRFSKKGGQVWTDAEIRSALHGSRNRENNRIVGNPGATLSELRGKARPRRLS